MNTLLYFNPSTIAGSQSVKTCSHARAVFTLRLIRLLVLEVSDADALCLELCILVDFPSYHPRTCLEGFRAVPSFRV